MRNKAASKFTQRETGTFIMVNRNFNKLAAV